MSTTTLSIHAGLSGSSRLRPRALENEGLSAADVLLLLGAGVAAAAATALLHLRLGIPGHAIIRAVFPMSLGLALAPRRMGGMVMGAGALGSALVIGAGGRAAIGVGAMTSLVLIGPFLDLALWRAKRGWQLYLGFAVAGLAANLAALTVRGGTKLVGLDYNLARPFAAWWFPAIVTYPLCGVLAGLLSAMVWFKLHARHRDGTNPECVS
jgi:hypothetical protein